MAKSYTSQQVLKESARLMTKTIRTAAALVAWACVWIAYGIIDDADHTTVIWFNLGLIVAAVIVGFWAVFARVVYWHATVTFEEEKKRADAELTRANIDAVLRTHPGTRRRP